MSSAQRTRARPTGPALDPDKKPPLRSRLRYAFDNTMARGTPALVGWLAAVTLVLIGFFTIVVLIAGLAPDDGDGKPGVVGQTFKSLLHALDPGTVAGDTGDWPFLLMMLLVTLGGLFVVSALIGVIATGLDSKIDEMRKGRSVVLERDHTLILGWSETIFTILSELEIANASERDPSVVVLADEDKVEMDDLIREKVGPKRTRVVTRSGSPIDLNDLAMVSPATARSIIVLAPAGPEPDTEVIKTVLALTRGADHVDREYHIIAEIHDPANLRPAGLVGGAEAVLIDKRETVAKLVVHAARQSGASVAFLELLDFGGEEIYFNEDPDLHGRPYGDALLAYEDCSVIGVIDAERRVQLNPAHDRVIEAGDELIAVAEDDAALAARTPFSGSVIEEVIAPRTTLEARPESVLVLGWNSGAPAVITEFDQFLKPGSDLHVVADEPEAPALVERCNGRLKNTAVTFQESSTTDREMLDALGVERFDHVIVLCHANGIDPQRADARTLVTLLHLRDIAERRGAEFSIVSEMLDDRNRQLAEVTQVDDVIVSGKVVSLMMAQISENKHLAAVFTQLFSASGSEIYLRPAAEYVQTGAEANYATVVEAARRRGESAIGYRRGVLAHDADADFGVAINPPKSDPFEVEQGDSVIVLAED
jgi:Trk K+ transport system NAD-binding subunit